MTPPSPEALETDPDYRAAVIDLLGVLAYGELTAFERTAADASMAPEIDDKAALAALATREFQQANNMETTGRLDQQTLAALDVNRPGGGQPAGAQRN